MYAVILMIHSGLRWLVLLALAARVGRAVQGMAQGSAWDRADRGLSGAALGLTHLQGTLGLALYFLSPKVSAGLADMAGAMKDPSLRFWTVEHITIMVLAVVAVQLGFSLSKRATSDTTRHRIALLGFGIGLAAMLAGIPYTFRGAL